MKDLLQILGLISLILAPFTGVTLVTAAAFFFISMFFEDY